MAKIKRARPVLLNMHRPPSKLIRGYGPHLTFDGYGADKKLLNDMQTVYDFLSELPKIINMHALTRPYVLSYDGADKPNDYGVTGFIMIAESHISIHTYPYNQTFFLDVFSCNQFDVKKAKRFIRKTFKVKDEETYLVTRGKNFRR